MLALVVMILVALMGAALVGASTPGLFWLTLVAIAAMLGTGAVGVRMLGARAEEEAARGERRASLTLVTSGRGGAHRPAPRDGGEASRAA